MTVSASGISGDREFPSTAWSVIIRARDPSSPDYLQNLGRLVELYWRPVYCAVRQGWGKNHDDAKDLTQEFFATVILDRGLLKSYARERGSFRTLLRATLFHFMRDIARSARRQKRGRGETALPLDTIGEEATAPVPGAEKMSPEQIFDLGWNQVVMSEALELLEKRLAAAGKTAAFEVFRRYDLEDQSSELSYADLGEALDLTAPQVKHALREARATFREIVTDLVRDYVDDPADLAAELRSLFGAP